MTTISEKTHQTSPKITSLPEYVVSQFGLKKGSRVADFGCGHGFFTVALARSVGPEGKVYAIDIQKATLDIVRAKARNEHLFNIELIWGDIDLPLGSKLRDNSMDFVCITQVLFQCEKKENVFQEAARILNESGRLAVIEWNLRSILFGPAMSLGVSQETVKDLARKAGFQLGGTFDTGAHHYGFFFTKN